MNNAVYVSEEGIAEARESLLSCASELSELFDSINSVTNSIGSNVSGFTEIETVVDGLKQINSAKDALIDKIKEFANYLTENVNPGYNAFQQLFAGLLGSSGSLFENLGNLFGFGSLGGNGYKDNEEGNNEDTSDEEYTGSHGGGGGSAGAGSQAAKQQEVVDKLTEEYDAAVQKYNEERTTLENMKVEYYDIIHSDEDSLTPEQLSDLNNYRAKLKDVQAAQKEMLSLESQLNYATKLLNEYLGKK